MIISNLGSGMNEENEGGQKLMIESDKLQLDVQAIIDLTKSVGFDLRSVEKWEAALERESLVAYIKNKDALLAFGIIEKRGDDYIIFDMCVNLKEQGKGYGSLVLDSLIQQAKDAGYRKIGLSAWSQNPTVYDFYKDFGFKDAKSNLGFKSYMEKDLEVSE